MACTAGCEEKEKVMERPGGTMGKAPAASTVSTAAVQGTIGGVSFVEGGVRLMRVRGYGLVTGLVNKGSRRCPEGLRNYLVDSIRRTRMSDPYRRKTGFEPTAGEMIDSPDTAVVMVEGEIPAGSVKGRRFDVRITAVDEDTQSLSGGVLLQTELKVFQSLSPQSVIEGKTLARAGGPIFINPFRQATATSPATDQREGSIIAGGTATEDRKLTLATGVEAYSTVRQIQDAINARFKADPPTAVAENSRNITLRIPQDYRGREGRFLELLMHLPLNNSQAEQQARGKILAAELSQPEAPHREIALALEGLGKPAVDLVRPLYANNNRQVSFAAATVGLRLGDSAAADAMIRHAKDRRSPFRYQAIRELGESQMPGRVTPTLRELLDGTDTELRILAYEALRLVDRHSITSGVVGEKPENFILELVPSSGTPLIYVRRTKAPRIALIGGDRMACKPPLLYADASSPITLTAKGNEKRISIIRKDPARNLGPYYVSLSLPVLIKFMGSDLRTDLDGKLEGLGLSYSHVLAVLYRLCENESIGADFKWEEQSSDVLLGPQQPMGRPESEL
jgi:flagellar basal body P-ring protein FlgI